MKPTKQKTKQKTENCFATEQTHGIMESICFITKHFNDVICTLSPEDYVT